MGASGGVYYYIKGCLCEGEGKNTASCRVQLLNHRCCMYGLICGEKTSEVFGNVRDFTENCSSESLSDATEICCEAS